jgi:hypothetical protein
MNPAMLAALIGLIEQAITQEPKIAAALHDIFSKPNPTPDDWTALRAQVLAKGYDDYVPGSNSPPA